MTNKKLDWTNRLQTHLQRPAPIPAKDLLLYQQLKNSGQSITNSINEQYQSVKNRVKIATSAIASGRRDQSASYYQMLAAVYSGASAKSEENYIQEIHNSTSYLQHLTNFATRYSWEGGVAEKQFERELMLTNLDDQISNLRIELGAEEAKVQREILPSALSPDDFALCRIWSGQAPTPNTSSFQKLISAVGTSECERLLSARIAEKAAHAYYTDLGFQVEDVSIQQMCRDRELWRDCDLIAGEMYIDVKNARASFSNPTAYVEHCIPRFKVARGSQAEVQITGVFSHYIPHHEITEKKSVCIILGQVSLPYARDLWRWTRKRFGEAINFNGLWKNNHFPSWIFEYPDRHYRAQNICRAKIDALLPQILKLGLKENSIPSWLFSLATCIEPSAVPLQNLQLRVLNDLHSMRASIGYSRPSIYLYILGNALSGLIAHKSFDEVFDPILPMIFLPVGDTGKISPLGLHDPQSIIANLVENLSNIYQRALDSQLKFIAFKMTHPLIIRGQLDDKSWITLFAYCGGHIEEPFRVKCGASPLVLGVNEICPSCGYLVCTACGSCSDDCSAGRIRRKDVAANFRKTRAIPDSPHRHQDE